MHCCMTNQEKIKICYILPEKAANTATHFAHKWELQKALEDQIKFFTYESVGMDFIKIVFARFRGCRIYYVHYSFKGALLAIVITKLFGGQVYYWNCGMPWLYKRSWLQENLFSFIMRHSIFVTGTKKLAAEYTSRYKLHATHVRVVPNYISIARQQNINKEDAREKLNIPKEAKVILFLHRLSRRKGAHVLPEIVRQFSSKKNTLFLIVGDGPERIPVAQKIAEYGLQDIVHWEGFVPNHRVPQYITAADVFIMPSEEEGMPNALLEVMAAGIPFVATDVGGVKEMTPPLLHEFVVPHDNVYGFTETLVRLLDDASLRKKISAIEQVWVERYDIANIAPEFLNLFDDQKLVR